jgi:hypothetical protein
MFLLNLTHARHHSYCHAEHSSKAAHPLSLQYRPYIMQFFVVSYNELLSRSSALSPVFVPFAYEQELASAL